MRISKGKVKKLSFHSQAIHVENVDASEAFKVYCPRDIQENVNGAFSLCDFLNAMVWHRKEITVCFQEMNAENVLDKLQMTNAKTFPVSLQTQVKLSRKFSLQKRKK
jgi:hypothetical protein